jgi:hypothetical protein
MRKIYTRLKALFSFRYGPKADVEKLYSRVQGAKKYGKREGLWKCGYLLLDTEPLYAETTKTQSLVQRHYQCLSAGTVGVNGQ